MLKKFVRVAFLICLLVSMGLAETSPELEATVRGLSTLKTPVEYASLRPYLTSSSRDSLDELSDDEQAAAVRVLGAPLAVPLTSIASTETLASGVTRVSLQRGSEVTSFSFLEGAEGWLLSLDEELKQVTPLLPLLVIQDRFDALVLSGESSPELAGLLTRTTNDALAKASPKTRKQFWNDYRVLVGKTRSHALQDVQEKGDGQVVLIFATADTQSGLGGPHFSLQRPLEFHKESTGWKVDLGGLLSKTR